MLPTIVLDDRIKQFPKHFVTWLDNRSLRGVLFLEGIQDGYFVYNYMNEPLVSWDDSWTVAFHGTWWYATWLILRTGVLLESDNPCLGHDFWKPGVYCSPNIDTALDYARPQVVFDDGVFYRVVIELRVNPDKQKAYRRKGGVQMVYPTDGVAIHSVLISTKQFGKGDERLPDWQPELEAVPVGFMGPEDMSDDTPWPPWSEVALRATQPEPVPAPQSDPSKWLPCWKGFQDPRAADDATEKTGNKRRCGGVPEPASSALQAQQSCTAWWQHIPGDDRKLRGSGQAGAPSCTAGWEQILGDNRILRGSLQAGAASSSNEPMHYQ